MIPVFDKSFIQFAFRDGHETPAPGTSPQGIACDGGMAVAAEDIVVSSHAAITENFGYPNEPKSR